MRGIEPPYAAWEAAVLPLNYIRFMGVLILAGCVPCNPLFVEFCNMASLLLLDAPSHQAHSRGVVPLKGGLPS